MPEISPLNEMWRHYASGNLKKKNFEGQIFQYILNNPRRFHLPDRSKDRGIDYLSWLYPRLSRAIDLYKDKGASFDTYLSAVVYWSFKEYRSKEADHCITEYACWKLKAEEMAVYSSEPAYFQAPALPKQLPNPQQLLILVLKSYYFVSEDLLSRVAPAIGIEKETIKGMIGELRKRRAGREEEIREFQERIYSQYYRCIAFEKRYNAAPEDSARREKMGACLERAKIRLRAMKKRLSGIRLDATNSQIAEILGIPKGTVDSNLFLVKAKWASGKYDKEKTINKR
jgi:hypothetical protein